MKLTKLKRAVVDFGGGLKVDAYELPSGERRIGLVGASLVLGYSRQWLSRVPSQRPKVMEALQGMGFTGSQFEGEVSERDGKSGSSRVKTISVPDFCVLVEYAASQKKKPAIALLRGSIRVSMAIALDKAFGVSRTTEDYDQELRHAVGEYAENLQDIADLALPGDPPELQDWNRSVNWLQ